MRELQPLTWKQWVLTGGSVWFMNAVFGKATEGSGRWLAQFGPAAYLDLAIPPALMFLAAFTSAIQFLRKYGIEPRRVRNLEILYPALLAVQGLLSILLVLWLANFRRGSVAFAVAAGVELVLGCVLAYFAVRLAVNRRSRMPPSQPIAGVG